MSEEPKKLKIKLPAFMGKKYPWGILLLLGFASILLCMIMPFFIVAPFPLTLAFLYYGRRKGVMLGLSCLVLFSFLVFKLQVTSEILFYAYLVSFLFAGLISEIVFRKRNPILGFIGSGAFVLLIIVSILGLLTLFTDFSIRTELETSVADTFAKLKQEKVQLPAKTSQEGMVIQNLIENPKKMVDEVMLWMPTIIFVGIYLWLWVNIFIVLRNMKFWRLRRNYPFALKDFIRFKVSEYFIVPLILSLLLLLVGEYTFGSTGVVVGGNILYCLGLFYFFQGLGIYLDFLTHVRLMGFMRTFLVALTVVLAWRVVAIVGVFDLWVNFRKFFKKKNDEGDML